MTSPMAVDFGTFLTRFARSRTVANTQRREHCYDPGLVRADRDNNPDPTSTPSLLIVNEMGIDIESACVTPEQTDRAMRLAYTWRDCFVTSLNEIWEAS